MGKPSRGPQHEDDSPAKECLAGQRCRKPARRRRMREKKKSYGVKEGKATEEGTRIEKKAFSAFLEVEESGVRLPMKMAGAGVPIMAIRGAASLEGKKFRRIGGRKSGLWGKSICII